MSDGEREQEEEEIRDRGSGIGREREEEGREHGTMVVGDGWGKRWCHLTKVSPFSGRERDQTADS